MPSLHRIRLEVDGVELLEARHLRATVGTWLEDDDEHRRDVKPFTLTPLHEVEGGVALDVALLDDGLRGRLEAAARAAVATPVRAGRARLRVVVDPDGAATPVVEEATWADLRAVEPAPEVTLALLTPTVFRHGHDEQVPFPLPGPVFGHHRARWNAFCPPGARMHLDLAELWLRVEAFEGRSGVHVDGHRTGPDRDGHRAVRPVAYTGFVGTVTYRAHSRRAAERGGPLRDWQALARFATFCGTGANTTIGMGVTRRVR